MTRQISEIEDLHGRNSEYQCQHSDCYNLATRAVIAEWTEYEILGYDDDGPNYGTSTPLDAVGGYDSEFFCNEH